MEVLTRAGVKAHGEVRNALFGYAAGLLLGSTAHKVIHLADRPILIIR